MSWRQIACWIMLSLLMVGSAIPTMANDPPEEFKEFDDFLRKSPMRTSEDIPLDLRALTLPKKIELDDPIDPDERLALAPLCDGDTCPRRQSGSLLDPWGCSGRSDRPHFSHHGAKKGEKEITAVSTSSCGIPAPNLFVENRLFRNHVLWWGEEGKTGRDFKSRGTFAKAVAVTGCNIDQCQVRALHTANISGQSIYWALTSNTEDINRCKRKTKND